MRLFQEWKDPGGKYMAVRYAGKFPEAEDEELAVEPELARR